MEEVDDFIGMYSGEKAEWLVEMINFMRRTFPEIKEVMSYKIPTFKFDKTYIAFSIAKDHFSFHSKDFDMIEELKKQLPKEKFGRGCVKVRFANKDAIPVLKEMCKMIVSKHKK